MIDPDSGVSLSKFSPESPKPAGAGFQLAFCLVGNKPVRFAAGKPKSRTSVPARKPGKPMGLAD